MLFAEQMAVSLLLEFPPTSLRQTLRKTDFRKSIALTFLRHIIEGPLLMLFAKL